MNRDFIVMGIYSVLSVMVMSGTMNWMSQQTTIHSQDAFYTAEKVAMQICRTQRINDCHPRLVNAEAPQQSGMNWQFQFRQPGWKSFTVEVQENGKTRVL